MFYKIADVARMLHLESARYRYLILRGDFPAPTHIVNGLAIPRYTEKEVQKIREEYFRAQAFIKGDL